MKPLLAALPLCLSLAATPSLAGTFTASGSVDGSDPTMPVVTINSPNCVSQGSTQVAYDVYQFTVDTSGSYTFSISGTNPLPALVSLYLFEGSFNPAAALPTCIAGDNSVPVTFTEALTAGTTYFAVPFDDTFLQFGSPYTLTIEGPGNILVVARVPEPSSALLALGGLAAFAAHRRRRVTAATSR